MSNRQGAFVPPGAGLKPPPLPYKKGACFTIKPHNPPPPLDNGRGYDDPKGWKTNPWPDGKNAPEGILHQYLAHPPRNTTPPKDQTPHDLKVTHQIRCGDGYLSQVVRCLVDGKQRVAKIFDPLYVGLERCEDDGFPPTYYSERSYSCEAAAYERIKEKGVDGKYTPKFYGCWYLEVSGPFTDSKGKEIDREVRLILQEYIPGDTIEALMERGDSSKFDSKTRVELMDCIMEAITRLTFIGVRSEDEHPGNYMVTKDETKERPIVLIDFSHSRVRDLDNSKWVTTDPDRKRKKPQNPMTALYSCWPRGCLRWIPEECNGLTKASLAKRLKHVEERWGESEDFEAPDPDDKERLYGSKKMKILPD